MRFEVSITIDAPPQRVWSELIDVEAWPRWTASITSLQRLDAGPLRIGSQARIKQPSVPTAIWTVTEFQPLRQFVWAATAPGATTVGAHVLTPLPEGRVALTLSIERHGFLAPLVDWLTAGLTRRYMNMEAEGMKRACESAPTQEPQLLTASHPS